MLGVGKKETLVKQPHEETQRNDKRNVYVPRDKERDEIGWHERERIRECERNLTGRRQLNGNFEPNSFHAALEKLPIQRAGQYRSEAMKGQIHIQPHKNTQMRDARL